MSSKDKTRGRLWLLRKLTSKALDRYLGGWPFYFPARISRYRWNRLWGSGRQSGWMDREVSPELERVIQEGRFPSSGVVLDIGCGTGKLAHWLHDQGYRVKAVDLSEKAIKIARGLYPGPSFHVLDICSTALEKEAFDGFVDRGCFHCVYDKAAYARNISRAAKPGAPLLLFTKAFREGLDRTEEVFVRVEEVETYLGPNFALEDYHDTFLDREGGIDATSALPGMVFFLRRRVF